MQTTEYSDQLALSFTADPAPAPPVVRVPEPKAVVTTSLRSFWVPEVVAAERLTDGIVDVNVDLSSRISLRDCERRSRSLPLIRLPYLLDVQYDRVDRVRSSATIGYLRKGLPPGNFGKTYRPSPLDNDEVLALIDAGRTYPSAVRDKALIALLWRTGLRISEALALVLDDLHEDASRVTVKHGKGDKHRVVGMDAYGWQMLAPWLELRPRFEHPDFPGLLFPVVQGKSRGLPHDSSVFRVRLHKLGVLAGITKRVHPHGLRHSLAVSLNREGVQLPYISRQLGHANVGITSTYLGGISNEEVVERVVARPQPTVEIARPAELQRADERPHVAQRHRGRPSSRGPSRRWSSRSRRPFMSEIWFALGIGGASLILLGPPLVLMGLSVAAGRERGPDA